MSTGLIEMPWWGYVLVALVFTHITIVSVTVYLHRNQAHRAVHLHAAVAHFFRLWLWLTTGMSTRGWTAVHRKHHAFVETAEDPHSPKILGIRKVLLEGAELYRLEAANADTLAKYGHGTPTDWVERCVYSKWDKLGISIMLITNVVLFGALGLTIWAVQMAWIPIFAAGIINGAGHWWGYRNFESQDLSTNIVPWGILIGGEELHNNHHAFASSARFSMKRWEFDIGWVYIRLLSWMKLAQVKKLAPQPRIDRNKAKIDVDTVSAVIGGHLHVMAEYAQRVVKRVHRQELRNAELEVRDRLKPIRGLITRSQALMDEDMRARLSEALAHSRPLAVVHQFHERLSQLFAQRTTSHEGLLQQLQEWCRQAEETGIQALAEFAHRLRGYTLSGVQTA